MVLKFYGFNLSPPSQLVAVVLYEKKIPFEFINVDLTKGENKAPEYLIKHPFGQVPLIDDEGLLVYESRAICRYLEAKHPDQGTKLIPTELNKLALFERASFTEVSSFDAYASPIFVEAVVKRHIGAVPDQERIDDSTKMLSTKLNIYDQILSKQRYLAGDEFTLADLAHLPLGVLLISIGIDITQDRPNVRRWFNDLADRDCWKRVKEGLKSTLNYV